MPSQKYSGISNSLGNTTFCLFVFLFCIHVEKYSDLYAFHYQPKEGEMVKQSSGWALFDSQNEYSRMGLPNDLWRSTSLNSDYEVQCIFHRSDSCPVCFPGIILCFNLPLSLLRSPALPYVQRSLVCPSWSG